MFKFTAIIRLSEDGNYEITFPAIKVLKAKGFTITDAMERGEGKLRKYIESKIRKGEDIPEDVKSISLNTEDVEEIIITKIVVFVDETGMLRA